MFRRYAPAAALLVATLLLPAGAGAHHARKGATTYGEIEELAVDGPLVAYDAGSRSNVGQRCNKVFAWNIRTGAHKKVSGRGTCEADSTSTGAGVFELAVAGKRIAWVTNQGGNSESYDDLYASSWGNPRERHLAHAWREGDVDGVLVGKWIGGLVGSGRLLAVNRWTTGTTGDVVNGKLQRIGHSPRTIASGHNTLEAAAADHGRIAVVRSNGDVALYSKAGTLIHTISSGPLRTVALNQTTLVVLTQSDKLELYSISTGSLSHTWRLKAHWGRPGHSGSAAGLGVYRNIAVYSSRNHVFAIRLSTGKSVKIAAAPREIQARLALDKPGAVYAYDTFNRKTLKTYGHVVLIPLRKIRRALS